MSRSHQYYWGDFEERGRKPTKEEKMEEYFKNEPVLMDANTSYIMNVAPDSLKVIFSFIIPQLWMPLLFVCKKWNAIILIKESGRFLDLPQFCTWCSQFGYKRLIKWARYSIGSPWDDKTSGAAAASGNIPLLEWLLANECPFSETTFASAIKSRDIKVLEWLRKKKCPSDSKIALVAEISGFPEILEWELTNGYGKDLKRSRRTDDIEIEGVLNTHWHRKRRFEMNQRVEDYYLEYY